MANTLKFKRGLLAGLPTAAEGEPLFTIDTADLYIGTSTGNQRFQKYIASGTTSQLLRGDGSLLTMPIVLTSPSNGQVLKYDGTNWVNSSDAGVTGSGAAGQVTYWGSSSTITGSNNLFWDATNNRLGIGTIIPQTQFDISNVFMVGNISSFPSATYDAGVVIARTEGSGSAPFNNAGSIVYRARVSSVAGRSSHIFYTGSPSTEKMRLNELGNLILGGTSDNGLRFQVTGDGYFSGSVGIGTTSLTGRNLPIGKNMTGGINAWGIINGGTIQSDVTNNAYYFQSVASTQATTFSLSRLYHYQATQGTFGAGSSIDSQYGFMAEDNLIGATNNYGFFGNIASGTGRWNLYMGGSADNFTAGDFYVGIPTLRTSDASIRKFILNGSQSGIGAEIVLTNETANDAASNAISFVGIRGAYGISGQIRTTRRGIMTFHTQDLQSLVSPPERMRLDASGNLGLGVVPSAWRSNERAFQIGTVGSISQVSGAMKMSSNSVYLTATPTYITSNFATLYSQNIGEHQWYTAPSGTAGGTITWSQPMTLFATGNLAIGTTTDAGYKLDVNGTMRVSGASTFNGAMTLAINQNSGTIFRAQNTTAGTASYSQLVVQSDASSGSGAILKVSSSWTTYKIQTPSSTALYNGTAGDIVILNDVAAGAIKMAAGASSTPHFTIANNGAATFSSSVTAASFIPTSSTIPTNGMYLSAANTLAFATASGNKLTISSTGLATFSDSARFSNQKGCIFVQTGGSLLGSISMDSGNAITIDNNGFFGLSVGTNYTMTGGNLGIGHNSFGTSATKTISVNNGTAPSSSPVDSFQMYSNDVVAGNAAPHFRTENGAVIKLYQETTAVGNAIISLGGGNAVLDDTEFDGYTLRQIVRALRNQGILA